MYCLQPKTEMLLSMWLPLPEQRPSVPLAPTHAPPRSSVPVPLPAHAVASVARHSPRRRRRSRRMSSYAVGSLGDWIWPMRRGRRETRGRLLSRTHAVAGRSVGGGAAALTRRRGRRGCDGGASSRVGELRGEASSRQGWHWTREIGAEGPRNWFRSPNI